jgi:uncharacterized protein (TIGR02118 family)
MSMDTKITVIFDNPKDPQAFEAGYPDTLALAARVPGLRRIESAKVWPKEDGTDTPAYRVLDLFFADYDAASEAVTTPEAGALFPSIFGLATGGVRIVFAELEQIEPPAGQGATQSTSAST